MTDLTDAQEHRRLIIIDGFNIMRRFKCLVEGMQLPLDSRMNAMVLLPITRTYIKQGFRVRIALRRLPRPFEVDNMYILNELNKMQLLIYPAKDYLEADDIMMLEIAAKYGAMIISNDAFSNHPQYREVAKNNTIKYKKVPNPLFSMVKLQHRLVFESKITLDASDDVLYCSMKSPEYRKVKESYQLFWSPTKMDAGILDSLWDYVYCKICYHLGFKTPPHLKFMKESDESCPKKFEEFKNQKNLFV